MKKGELVMKTLHSSVSELAIIESWNQNKRLHHRESIMDDWMVRYFPPHLFYIRPLSLAERLSSGYDGDLPDVWHGVFESVSGRMIVVSDDLDRLFVEARKEEVVLVYCH